GETSVVVALQHIAILQQHIRQPSVRSIPRGCAEVYRFGQGLDGPIKVAEPPLTPSYTAIEGPQQPGISYADRHGLIVGQQVVILWGLREQNHRLPLMY